MNSFPRTLQLVVVCVAAAVALAFGSSSGAHAQGQADELEAGPDRIWDVITPDSDADHTRAFRALIHDFAEYDGTVYAGGIFQQVKGPNGAVVDRAYLAAFDLNTGVFDPVFAPVLDGPVLSIVAPGDGTLLVGGVYSGGIVRIDATTGAPVAGFAPGIENTGQRPAVWDMELVGSQLYVGGTFDSVGGVARENVVRLDFPSGAVSAGWTASTQGIPDASRGTGFGRVMGMAVDAARDRLYLAGTFDAVNNDAASDNFAIVSLSTGAAVAGVPQGDPVLAFNHDRCAPGDPDCWHYDNWYYDVQVDPVNDTVWLGGQAHTTIKLRGADLAVQKHSFTNRALNDTSQGGDTQAIYIGKTTVWSGCHCWGSVKVEDPLAERQFGRAYQQMVIAFRSEEAQNVRGQYGMDRVTGELTPQIFDMSGQGGAYALLEDSNGRLWAGGHYFSGGGRAVNGLARFTPVGGVAVAAPTECTVTEADGGIDVSWARAVDDRAVDFVVRRSRDGGASSWAARVAAPGTAWTNTNVSVGSSYSYTVQARQGSSVSTVTTCAPNPIVFGAASAPVAPTRCIVYEIDGALRLVWVRADNDNADRFIVRRSRDGNALSWAARVDVPRRSWNDTNVVAGPGYSYVVETHAGAERSVATGCTPDPISYVGAASAPVAPTACTVVEVNGDVAVSWVRAANDNADRFIVRRSRDGNNPSWAARVNAPGSAWTDTNVLAGPAYGYLVETHAGNERSVGTTCTPNPIVVAGLVPVAPASCAVVVVGGAVEVSWVAGVNDASEAFIVRRSRDGNNPSWAARVNVPGTSWTDTNLVAGASYTYSVEGRLGNTSSTVTACAGGPVGI
jgi:hypothetical protein